ncbi:enoyl-CoA hydratase/isomerase family protein [Micromonospora sp. Llam7]|uniref:enoyl-CoA-hydratase DpgD n=1 Tax=Micromonospora tarapacensis TaxID=2835305 RepID=UPI001C83C896|nr:enoyl-CoA-hydratase DpgD [Micromonospora tarapacensis]MBX7268163.1 enoyl-CoA hydratase/isomerase family protein [Micromonospora tarapacensis]
MERIRYDKRDHVAYVTINRPAVLNALDLLAHEELGQVWDDVEGDDDVWVVVLTGSGDRAFCVGQDLKELAERTGRGAPPKSFGSEGLAGHPRLTERFTFSKPVVARVNGYALGGGFELALACDIVVAAAHATFGLPEVRLGQIAGAGGVFRLTRQAPFKVAMGHLLTGRELSAARAYELGLVNEVVPAERLDACVDGWVADLLRCAPLSVRATKQAASASAHLSLNEAFAARYPWEERRLRSVDTVEGPRAFTEKRPPRWTGE